MAKSIKKDESTTPVALDQKDIAIAILNKLITNPRASLYLKSKAKLDLGDIYLTRNEPWESTLLYSQVEKTQKENPIAYEAKLKNARLSYFKAPLEQTASSQNSN